MPRPTKQNDAAQPRLAAADIEGLPQGRYPVHDRAVPGLYVEVTRTGGRSFTLRYWIAGRERYAGLGAWPATSLAKAKALAKEMRDDLARGIDPIEQRRARRESESIETPTGKTVREVCAAYRATHTASWRPNYIKAVLSLHSMICEDTKDAAGKVIAPGLGDRPIAALTTTDVKEFLAPHWQRAQSRARKAQSQLALAYQHAQAHGWVPEDRANPAGWQKLRHLLPKPKDEGDRHLRSLDWRALPSFWAALSERHGAAAEAMRLLVLTGCRTSEIVRAVWSEVNWDEAVLTIPASRMKAAREHIVPLVPSAIAALRRQEAVRRTEFIFASNDARQPISGMATLKTLDRMGWRDRTTGHGMRASLRSWCQDQGVDHHLAEALLAHRLDPVVSAYARSALVERRREVLLKWEAFVIGGSTA